MPGPWEYVGELTNPTSQEIIPFQPPAPAFLATISYNRSMTTIPALIDTGASITIIPHYVATLLSLRQTGWANLTSANGQKDKRPVYKADLSFLGFSFRHYPMVSFEARKHILIGRDIINQYKTSLDGPNLQFSIE